MEYALSQQVSATYLRNNASAVIDEVMKEGIRVIVRRSKPIAIVLPIQEYENLKNPAKPKKHKKFDLKKLRENNYFDKYIGCWDKEFGDLTSIQITRKWTDYVD